MVGRPVEAGDFRFQGFYGGLQRQTDGQVLERFVDRQRRAFQPDRGGGQVAFQDKARVLNEGNGRGRQAASRGHRDNYPTHAEAWGEAEFVEGNTFFGPADDGFLGWEFVAGGGGEHAEFEPVVIAARLVLEVAASQAEQAFLAADDVEAELRGAEIHRPEEGSNFPQGDRKLLGFRGGWRPAAFRERRGCEIDDCAQPFHSDAFDLAAKRACKLVKRSRGGDFKMPDWPAAQGQPFDPDAA